MFQMIPVFNDMYIIYSIMQYMTMYVKINLYTLSGNMFMQFSHCTLGSGSFWKSGSTFCMETRLKSELRETNHTSSYRMH